MADRRSAQQGFTLVELMITVAIIAILAAVAVGQYRDHSRRAKLSELLLAAGPCKTAIGEGYLTLTAAPQAGGWGCEAQKPTQMVDAIQTSAHGVIRLSIANLDGVLNGHFIHLVPVKRNAGAMAMPADLGSGVHEWLCGSNLPLVRSALPASCRADTSAQAGSTFE